MTSGATISFSGRTALWIYVVVIKIKSNVQVIWSQNGINFISTVGIWLMKEVFIQVYYWILHQISGPNHKLLYVHDISGNLSEHLRLLHYEHLYHVIRRHRFAWTVWFICTWTEPLAMLCMVATNFFCNCNIWLWLTFKQCRKTSFSCSFMYYILNVPTPFI